jgi:hypothetical protein
MPQDFNIHPHSSHNLTTHTLHCFNLHYETRTNYNLMATEIHNIIPWKIYGIPLCKIDKHNIKVNTALLLAIKSDPPSQ